MDDFNKKISGIRKLMKDMKANLYAIENPDLVVLDEFNKNLYIKLLCTVVEYENNPSDMQVLYLKRIIKGIGLQEPIENYMRKAMEVSDDDIKEFIDFAKKGCIKFYFALESILLAALGDSNQPNMEYVAEIIELCGVTKNDLEYLSLVAKSILQQDSSYYDGSKKIITEECMQLNFKPYIENYYVGVIADNQYVICYSAPNKKLSNGIAFENAFTAKQVIFKNMIIHVTDEWNIKRCENVLFENCEIYGEKYSIILEVCESVTFKNCKISDFSTRAFINKSVNEIKFMNCGFDNCMYRYSSIYPSTYLGAIIYIDKNYSSNNVKIHNCLFIDCGTINSYSTCASSIISNGICEVLNSKFLNCWFYGGDNKERNYGTLFAKGSTCINNQVIDSMKLVEG